MSSCVCGGGWGGLSSPGCLEISRFCDLLPGQAQRFVVFYAQEWWHFELRDLRDLWNSVLRGWWDSIV